MSIEEGDYWASRGECHLHYCLRLSGRLFAIGWTEMTGKNPATNYELLNMANCSRTLAVQPIALLLPQSWRRVRLACFLPTAPRLGK